MGMLKREMVKGVKCHVKGHLVTGDSKSKFIDSKGQILSTPVLSTVRVRLDTPPDGVPKVCMVPIEAVYWTNQD